MHPPSSSFSALRAALVVVEVRLPAVADEARQRAQFVFILENKILLEAQ
jgi:hypothetical protein